MNNNTNILKGDWTFSFRQKIMLAFYLLVATLISLILHTDILTPKHANTVIFFFGILWPLLLLTAFIQDLRNPRYFTIWFIISIFQFIITLLTYHNPSFIISPIPETGEFSLPGDEFLFSSTESLKSLLLFLLAYQALRMVYQRHTGNELTNSFALSSWYNERDERKITTLDVFMNLSLYLVIVIGNFLPLSLFF